MKGKKIALTVLFLAVAVTLTAAETGTSEYVPGELIVKLENGIIDVPGFDETSIDGITILNPLLITPLQQYNVRSVERVFKSIFARPPFTFTTKGGLDKL